LGRYYSRHEGSLYIYVTGGDEMIDLKLFPPELNLFDTESSWRINNRTAIVNDADETSLDKAETILGLNGFKRRDIDKELIENYFAMGQENVLETGGLPGVVTIPELHGAPELEAVDEGIIMPRIVKPAEPLIPASSEVPSTTLPLEITSLPAMESPTLEQPPAEEETIPKAVDEQELVEHLLAYIRSRGFVYPERLVKNYYVSLKTKPLVILAGYSGMGKTALTRLVAEAVSDDVEDQYLRVSVQPNWLDDKGLMGFYNPLMERYVSTPFLDFLLKAADNPDKPYFVCLDEMNLSRVEYYLSRLLSAMESIDREVAIHGIRGGVETDGGRRGPSSVKLPENLFITGTINVDESTYPLSPKLLDRANIIEFFEVDLRGHPPEEDYSKRLSLDVETIRRFRGTLQPSEEAQAVETLAEVNAKTIKYGFPISYRVRREVLDYVANSRGIYSDDEEENLNAALDIQIKQRVLTKIAGTESLRPLLEDLRKYFQGRLPLSAEKVERMLERLEGYGYTNFYI